MVGAIRLERCADNARYTRAASSKSAATGELPDLAELRRQFMPSSMAVPIVTVTLPAAVAYDALLSAPQEWLRS